ncbi:MAG TPA: hypothetical protein VGY66_28615 [Gemmataceae bacterium]|jgi:hypothetical protein|nr:hypothetical protein [Gemmataceae bacterium]
MPKRLKCLRISLSVLSLMILGWIVIPGRSSIKIDKSTHEQIKMGLSERQVVEILGGPAGDYTSTGSWAAVAGGRSPRSTEVEKQWISDEGSIRIIFGPDGSVADKRFAVVGISSPSFFGRVRRWIERLFNL